MGRPRLYETNAEKCRAYRERCQNRLDVNGNSRYPRHDFDLYETPIEVIEAALEMVTVTPASILDVGAHDGRWGRTAKQQWPVASLAGVELREMPHPAGFDRWHQGDFLEGAHWMPSYDLIIGNPPYNLAEPIIRACLNLLNPGGELLFLLQSQFLHSQSRRWGLFTEYPLRRLYPLARRVSYHSGQGGTRDATAFLWQQGYRGSEEMFRGRY